MINTEFGKAYIHVKEGGIDYIREYNLPITDDIEDHYYEFTLPSNFGAKRITDFGINIFKVGTEDITFDVEIGTTSILTTTGTIEAGELFSKQAAVQPVIDVANNLIIANTILRINIISCGIFDAYGLSIWIEAT